jgi:hypothetical protein
MRIWKIENWKMRILKIENWKMRILKIENWKLKIWIILIIFKIKKNNRKIKKKIIERFS